MTISRGELVQEIDRTITKLQEIRADLVQIQQSVEEIDVTQVWQQSPVVNEKETHAQHH